MMKHADKRQAHMDLDNPLKSMIKEVSGLQTLYTRIGLVPTM